MRRLGPLRWKLPVTTSVAPSGGGRRRASSRAGALPPATTRQRSTTRKRSSAARSLVTVSAMPAPSQATSGSPVTFAKSRTASVRTVRQVRRGQVRVRRSSVRSAGRAAARARRPASTGAMNRSRAAQRSGCSVGAAGIVAERFAEVRDRLRQRVVGDVGAGPDAVEQRFLGHQRGRVLEQVEQQVQQLRRQIERLPGVRRPDRPCGRP